MKKKSTALLVSLVLLLTVSVGATLAFLITSSGPIENTFTPSKVTTTVVEELNQNVKSNVKIKNTGDTTAYIRAAVVVTWQDGDGNVYGEKPVAGKDYNIVLETESSDPWFEKDGFYYHKAAVKSEKEDAANCMTSVLITSCSPVANKAPSGYFLNVEILGSGIQSVPDSVVKEAWKVVEVGTDGLQAITTGGAGA